MKKILMILLLGSAFMSLQACFIFETLSSVSESSEATSESLESVSKSIKSISSSINSSSESSSGDEEEKRAADLRYRHDVSELTAIYASRRNAGQAFTRDLGQVARQHGITDWEGNASTYIAIGKGFQKAGVARGLLQESFKEINPAALRLIQKGYNS